MDLTEFSEIKKNIYPEAILSDSQISGITFTESGIVFQFQNGIVAEELAEATTDQHEYFRTREAAILINDCNFDDLRCRINTRFRLFGHVFYIGRDLEPKQLFKLLKKQQLEVIDELYSYNSLFWRCVILPYKKGRSYSGLEISIDNVDEITYLWNDELPEKRVDFN